MATITTNTFLDGGVARTAGETWQLNGAVLTIRTDTRWHANAPASMTGSIGGINTSTGLGGGVFIDASNVRWIPYTSGSGTVPAIGTTITQAGSSASGYLLGVWPDLASAPTAVGASMPAAGFLKFREVADGPFASSGSFAGIGADAAGDETAGWIEVVGDSGTQWSFIKLGDGFKTRGNWFYLDNTNGSAGQQIQTPTNGGGSLTNCNGVQIETAPGSGVFEWWPTALSTVQFKTANMATDERAKFVQALGNGEIRIGSDGTSNIGFVPPSGCRVRMPNILQRGCSTGTRASNVAPNSGGNQIFANNGCKWDCEFIEFQSLLNSFCSYAALANIKHCTLTGNITATSPVAALQWEDSLFGGYMSNTFQVTNIMGAVSGGNLTDCKFVSPNGNQTGFLTLSNCRSLVFANAAVHSTHNRTSSPSYGVSLTNCRDVTFNGLSLINFCFFSTICSNITINDLDYIDRMYGNTNTASLQGIIYTSYTEGLTVDGITFGFNGLLSDCNPRGYMIQLGISTSNSKFRNAGTAIAPLQCIPSALCQGVATLTSQYYDSLKFQNMHLSGVVSYTLNALVNAGNVVAENCTIGSAPNNPGSSDLNLAGGALYRGVSKFGPYTFAGGRTSGFPFFDYYDSDTTGYLAFTFKEIDSFSAAYTEYSVTPKQGTGWPGDGTLSMDTNSDYIIIESPYFIKGHTGFRNVAPTITGSVTAAYTISYQLDKGAGYSGTWQELTAANLVADNTGLSPSGFKIKIRCLVTAANTSSFLTFVNIATTTSATARNDNQYPLDTVTILLEGLQPGSEVRAYVGTDPATAVEIGGIESVVGTTWSFTHSSAGEDGYIAVFALGFNPLFIPRTYASSDSTLLISQVVDRTYTNPA